ncbi:class II fumarate hydratase [Simiduia curdlanivorans]|uniref:Fumarate hydratase class II n=1 Tax=Simiduia curdlanivorans TaxID=1492769 RepID=A0ABV8V6E6_9GAMM|nr:class II fumarate hydratase [Simiduia curdlanivorans]MDN3640758.1 class II fumarate hydratase [Simiduia curdlanivorans]
MGKFRIETDSMGEVEVPAGALFGAQTQRAVNNFPISGLEMPSRFIHALAKIKRCAALANKKLTLLDAAIADAIVDACDKMLSGQHGEQFPVDVFQTGSGTSTNMNINEVIATLASRILNQKVDPNDHVNSGQSSNDVIPTAIHVSAVLAVEQELLPALDILYRSLIEKAKTLESYVKTGRTHLMDAMPIRFDQELSAWAGQIQQSKHRLQAILPELKSLAQGGTAVGTGINTSPEFAAGFVKELSDFCAVEFTVSENFFVSISSQDTAVALSGQLKTLAVSLMKIGNDLRWMNSGPLSGLGEIQLEAVQPGSSIMPGKVNPVIPEAITMVAAQVMGNDTTITVAGQSGNFQLNAMLPVIAYNLLQSIELLANSTRLLADKAVSGFTVNKNNIERALARNPILVTALNPLIGYQKAAAIAKKAYASGRTIIDVAVEETNLSRSELERILNPSDLTKGGVKS